MSNVYDLSGERAIKQGADRVISMIVKEDDDSPINISNYYARMQVRSNFDSNTVLDELTIDNDRITITEYVVDAQTFYKISLIFPNAVTSKYKFRNAFYDLEIVSSGGLVTRLLQGVFEVSPEVTR